MNPSSSPCWFFQLQGSCSAGDQCPFSHASQDTTSKAASNGSLAYSEVTPSQTERSNKQVCYFWKAGRCKKGNQCGYAHTDTVEAESKSSMQHSPPSSSASSDDSKVSDVNSQEDQPRDDETCIDNAGVQDTTHEDVEEQPLQQGDFSSSDFSEKDATNMGTEALDLANDEQNDGNEEPEQVESPAAEPSTGDVVNQRLNADHIRGEIAPTRQTDPERIPENVAPTDQLNDGDRSLETVTADDHIREGGSTALDNVLSTAEHDGRDGVLVQGQQEHDTGSDHRPNFANDDDHIPHWTEYADPYANPFVAFCKIFARGRCNQDMNCTYRHALTVQEYLLLFRVEPIIWSQYAQNEYSDPPLIAKNPTSLGPCAFHPLGKCRNGNKCPYTHDLPCIPEYDEHNHEEPGPSYNGNEQTGWSSRQQRPCRYFVNYGSCKFDERCEYSHDLNDLNTNLDNNIEFQDSEWNSWNQLETVNWGAENDPSSNEGHPPESGINDENAKGRPADEEESSKHNEQNIDDSGWGNSNAAETQWGNGNTGETQWEDDNAGQTQLGDDHAGQTQMGDDNAGETQLGEDNAGGTQWRDDNTATTQWENGNAEWGDNNGAATQWGDDNSATTAKFDYNESGSSRNGSRQSDRTVKTCRAFARGNCQRATNCRFAHERNDFVHNDRRSTTGTYVTRHDTWNTSPNNQKARQSTANDGWKGENSMKPDRTSQVNGQGTCWYFSTGGGCTRPNCLFLHEASEPTNSSSSWNSSDKQPDAWSNPQSEDQENTEWGDGNMKSDRTSQVNGQEICRYFTQGGCTRPNCHFLHEANEPTNSNSSWNSSDSQHDAWNNPQSGDQGNAGRGDGNMKPDRTSQANGQEICWYFTQGGCTRPNCHFLHEANEPTNSTSRKSSDSRPDEWDNSQSEDQDPNAASWNDNWLEMNFSSSYESNTAPRRRQELCMYFGQGFCSMGTNCRLLHVNPDELDEEEVQDSEEPEKQDQELHYDADNQTERSIFNCMVAFGAGCQVPYTLTATDPTQIILSGLPPKFSPEELNNTNINGLREVHLDKSRKAISAILEFESPQDTLRSLHRLHRYVLRNSTLTARLEHPIGSENDSKLYEVMITWPSPSKVAWARYPSVTLAKDDANRLNGQMFDGRKVQASYLSKKGQTSMFSVQISNLPPESSGEAIKQLCNECQFVNMAKPTYTTSPVEHIKEILMKHGDLVDFDAPDLPPCEECFLAFARFSRSEDAAAAIAAFHKLKDGSLGAEDSFKAEAVNHVRFKIPSKQFQYIQEDLEKLHDSHQQQCTIFFVRSTTNVDIYAFASVNDNPAFMQLLTSLNSLVNGEVLMQDGNAVWDDYFHTSSSVKAIETTNTEHLQQYSVLVMPDRRTQQITVLGEVLNRPRAKDHILKIIKKVRVAWNEIPFERTFVRWYLEQGRDQIQSDSDIGQNKVSIDLTVPKLIVRGDAKVLAKVKGYMHAAVTIPDDPSNLAYDDICHICTQKAISPVKLPCKHCYCKECLTAFLSYAVESHSMPLQCIAIEAAADSNNTPCSKDVPYPVVRDLLPMGVEEQLLRSRFLSHVRSDVKQLFFCPTPNCETVHRHREGGANLLCQTCLNEFCSSCQTRSHPGAVCKEWLRSIDRI